MLIILVIIFHINPNSSVFKLILSLTKIQISLLGINEQCVHSMNLVKNDQDDSESIRDNTLAGTC